MFPFVYFQVECAENKPSYFAKLLRKSIEGLGTRDDDLIRLLTTRSQVIVVITFEICLLVLTIEIFFERLTWII